MKEKIISVCTELKDVIDGIGAVQTAWGLIVACALIIAFVFCVFMYINSRCIAFPCSFGIGDDTFSVNLKQHSLQEAWESESFAKFREKQTKVCANCTTGICRSCGLELGLNLCGNIKGNLQ